MPSVPTRFCQPREPVLRLFVDDTAFAATVVSFDARRAYVRSEAGPSENAVLAANWGGAGRIQLEVVVERASEPGPDGRRNLVLGLRRAASHESAAALRRFIRVRLGGDPHAFAFQKRGEVWWVALRDDLEAAPKPGGAPTEPVGPPARIAGTRQEKAPPLETGRPATTVDGLRAYLQSVDCNVGVYVNVPCAYLVAGAPYWGRALRLNDRFLQVNTGNVVPGLGVRLRCDLTVELDGVKRGVSIFGIMTQRKDPPPGTMYKASLMVRLARIDEGDSPGLLIELLDNARKNKERPQE